MEIYVDPERKEPRTTCVMQVVLFLYFHLFVVQCFLLLLNLPAEKNDDKVCNVNA